MLRIDTEKGEIFAAGTEKDIIAELACVIHTFYNAIDDDAKQGLQRAMTALIAGPKSPVWEKMKMSEGDVCASICIPVTRDK